MTARARAAAGLAAAAALVAACGGGDVVSGCEPVVPGIPVVANRGPGEWQRAGLEPRLAERWRVGGTNEGQELAVPIGAAASRTGEIAVAAALRSAPRPDRPAAFGRLVLDADGRLWVQRDRPPALPDSWAALFGAAGAEYDVFAADGRFLGTLRAPPAARIQAAAGTRVWAMEVGPLDEVWLVAYVLDGLEPGP